MSLAVSVLLLLSIVALITVYPIAILISSTALVLKYVPQKVADRCHIDP